jgi:hypothetical protein
MDCLSQRTQYVRWSAVAVGLVVLIAEAGIARADLTTNVFTTQQDFTGWSGADFNFQPFSSPDFDGSSVNGIGNTSSPGGAGTPGSLGVSWQANNFSFGFSQDETTNTRLIKAMGTGGLLKYQFSDPDNNAGAGGYFAIGMALNYDGNFFGGAWYDGGIPPQYAPVTNEHSGDTIAYARYTFNPAAVATYFQIGFFYNSNYAPFNPFFIDAIQIVRPTGDFNFDGHVNALDIAAMQSALADQGAYDTLHGLVPANLVGLGDFNGDGKFTNADLQGFLNYLKAGNGSLSSVPEPASLLLLGLAIPALATAAYRRRKSNT